LNIFANGCTGTIGKHFSNNIKTLDGDLVNQDQKEKLREFCRDDLTFIHAAGVVGNENVERNLKISYRVNVIATEELAVMALAKGIKKYIYISSSQVYGSQYNANISESSALHPENTYAKQKKAAEDVLLKVFKYKPEKLLILRVFSVLDWGMPDYTLGSAIEKIIGDPENSTLRNSNNIRDFLTPKQVALNIETIATNHNISGIYNLCTGVGYTLKQAAILMSKQKNITLPNSCFESKINTFSRVVGNNLKLISSVNITNLKWNFDNSISND